MPRIFNVEGELTVGKRIKCSTEEGDSIFCTRTHELSAPITDTVTDTVETWSINGHTIIAATTSYMDSTGWYIQRTEPVVIGRGTMRRTYYKAFCPDHTPSIEPIVTAAPPDTVSDMSVTPLPDIDPYIPLDIDFSTPVAEVSASEPVYRARPEHQRDCANCYFTQQGRMCPGSCLGGYSDRVINEGRSQYIDMNIPEGLFQQVNTVRAERQIAYAAGEEQRREEERLRREREIQEQREREERERREREEREVREEETRESRALETMRVAHESSLTGMWCHHKKGGRL